MNGVPVDTRLAVPQGETWEAHLSRMEQDRVCAEAPVIMATATLLEIRIAIYWARAGATPVDFIPANSEEARSIKLGYLPTCLHYESVSCKSCCLMFFIG